MIFEVVQRILGASGIANFVRSNWSIQRDNDDQGLRLFMRLKANLSPDTVNGIKFTIRHVGPYQQSICCAWAGTTDKTPDEVMGNGRGAKPSADRWLVEFLKQHGETKRHEIMAAAAQAGHSQSAVQKAKARNSKILDFQIGIPGKAYWRLDGNDQEH